MIAGLEGKLESLGLDWAIIKVGGVSFQVFMPTSTMSALGAAGEEVKLFTHLYLREDNAALYGFASTEELGVFQMLIGVAGVGPKVALSILSSMNPEQLSLAIATENIDFLSQVPGVGRKMAGRLVLELKGKLEVGWVPASVAGSNADVVAALTSLGYSVREAAVAVAALTDSEMGLEEKVKIALQHLGAG